MITFPSMFAYALSGHMITALTAPAITVTGVGTSDTKLASVTGNLALLTFVTSCACAVTRDVVTDSAVMTVTREATVRAPPTSRARRVTVDPSPT